MKRLALTLCLSAFAVGAFAQGTINFLNGTTTFVRTNASGAGGNANNTSILPNGFYFAVFTAPSTVTSATALDLLSASWTFNGIYGTNTIATTGGRFSGGGNVATTTGWAPGNTNSFMVAGWSANLGHDWAEIRNQLTGATFSGGVWSGPNWQQNANEFFGVSGVGFGAAGGGASGLPAFSLFGSTATAQGTPISSGFDLFTVSAVPEPSTFALAGLGAAALVIFRRRKA